VEAVTTEDTEPDLESLEGDLARLSRAASATSPAGSPPASPQPSAAHPPAYFPACAAAGRPSKLAPQLVKLEPPLVCRGPPRSGCRRPSRSRRHGSDVVLPPVIGLPISFHGWSPIFELALLRASEVVSLPVASLRSLSHRRSPASRAPAAAGLALSEMRRRWPGWFDSTCGTGTEQGERMKKKNGFRYGYRCRHATSG
jgi:hypothetical protein